MTAPDLDALDALLASADALPWEVQKDGWTIRVEQKDTEQARGWRVAMTHDSGPNRVEREVANAELIVAAVNALPGLIARLRAAEADAERYRAIRNDAVNPMVMFACKADDARMVGVESMLAGAELDAAIDAARANVKIGDEI